MIFLTDTHCHLHFPDYEADREAVIARARQAGVGRLITVGTDPVTNQAAFAIASNREGVYSTVGLHPHHAADLSEAQITELVRGASGLKPVAIGEVGLDFFKSQAPEDRQRDVFIRMIELGLSLDLPLVVHSRNAQRETLDLLKSHKGVRAVMHCFSYDRAALREILDLGFSASFTCNLTYKKSDALVDAAVFTPADRLMLETDAPYLSPQAKRGQRNEPAYLVELLHFLAGKRGVEAEALAAQTSLNAETFFNLKNGVIGS